MKLQLVHPEILLKNTRTQNGSGKLQNIGRESNRAETTLAKSKRIATTDMEHKIVQNNIRQQNMKSDVNSNNHIFMKVK